MPPGPSQEVTRWTVMLGLEGRVGGSREEGAELVRPPQSVPGVGDTARGPSPRPRWGHRAAVPAGLQGLGRGTVTAANPAQPAVR